MLANAEPYPPLADENEKTERTSRFLLGREKVPPLVGYWHANDDSVTNGTEECLSAV